MRRLLILLVLAPLAVGAGDFVTNPASTLPGPKSDQRALPAGSDPNKFLRAADYNALRDGLFDVRAWVYAPTFTGDVTAPNVTATGNVTGASVTATGSVSAVNVNASGSVTGNGSSVSVTATGSATPRQLKDWLSAEEVIRPSGDVTGATDVAAINAATAAGKAVRLTDGSYYVNAPISLGNASTKDGYTIRGSPPKLSNGGVVTAGTVIKAVGSTACMEYVPTTYAAQPTLGQVYADMLNGVDVEDIAFDGCTYAIRVGGLYNSGVNHATFRNLLSVRHTQWGFWFENTQNSAWDVINVRLAGASAAGNMMFAASQSGLNTGNNSYRHLFSETLAKRGIVFKAYAGVPGARVAFNDLNVFGIQNNSAGLSRSATATSAGATALTLSGYGAGSSISSFPVDMPVTVGTTSLGLTKWQSYFVVSNDGASTITISDFVGGSAKTISAGSVTLYANGFPSIEVVGYGSISDNVIEPSTFMGIDAEGGGGSSVLLQNANAQLGLGTNFSDQGFADAKVFTSLVARNAAGSVITTAIATTDFDAQSASRLFLWGASVPTDTLPGTAIIQATPAGIWQDRATSRTHFNLVGVPASIRSGSLAFGPNDWLTLTDFSEGTGQFKITNTAYFNVGGNVVFRDLAGTTTHSTLNYMGQWVQHAIATSVPAYGPTVNINAALGNLFVIAATDSTAFTVANPTNGKDGQRITIQIRNGTGGALGALTFDGAYRAATWTQPAAGFSRSIDFFYYNGAWVEVGRTPADVPN